MYAFITDVKENNGEIISCKLLNICTKIEKSNYIQKYIQQGIKFECHRTTFNAPNIGIA